MKITVTGLGYLGVVHCATLAEMGHIVLGMDVDVTKVEHLKNGGTPFTELGLEELLKKHTADGALTFTDDPAVVGEFGKIHFICVGTPVPATGLPDMSYLFSAVENLAPHLHGSENLIIGKSTTPPGTAAKLLAAARRLAPYDVDVAWNPEFLREGSAVYDSLYPDRLVFGVNDVDAETTLNQIYSSLIPKAKVVVTDVRTAELAKLAANAFISTKINFINGVAQYCEQADANVQDIAKILGLDKRIGSGSLKPGLGYGGGCLPKDLQMLIHEADEHNARRLSALLKAGSRINAWRREQVITLAGQLLKDEPPIHPMLDFTGRQITILGLSFKAGTDDMRESPALYLAHTFAQHGASVVTHDPAARYPGFLQCQTPEEAIEGADVVILATEHTEYDKIDPFAFPPGKIIDCRYVLDRRRWENAGWDYHEVGR